MLILTTDKDFSHFAPHIPSSAARAASGVPTGLKFSGTATGMEIHRLKSGDEAAAIAAYESTGAPCEGESYAE